MRVKREEFCTIRTCVQWQKKTKSKEQIVKMTLRELILLQYCTSNATSIYFMKMNPKIKKKKEESSEETFSGEK